mmetsp:Transcript_27777/g.40907  ORF Transcript_27777/g.40907 Transcript_27777/m.40907 type:complete len:107 (-) Transcript_27777:639-959(-)
MCLSLAGWAAQRHLHVVLDRINRRGPALRRCRFTLNLCEGSMSEQAAPGMNSSCHRQLQSSSEYLQEFLNVLRPRTSRYSVSRKISEASERVLLTSLVIPSSMNYM